MKTVIEQVKSAYDNKSHIQFTSTAVKNQALDAIAAQLVHNAPFILECNARDLNKGKEDQLSTSLLDRLTLSHERITAIADSIQAIARLSDPIGNCLEEWTRPNGLHIKKVSVPLGCIGLIYEARPNVTADAIAIAIKTNNALVLRGSASAYHTNWAITSTCKKALQAFFSSVDFIELLEDTSRDSVIPFIQCRDYLDLVIPRGSAGLIQHVITHANVPTIETGAGNCHVYIDKSANLDKAIAIADNSKTSRPSVCNACETLLVHREIAPVFLPKITQHFVDKQVTIHGCHQTQTMIPSCLLATEADWQHEYHDLAIAIKIVDSIEDALSHIRTYSTLHTEAIVSDDTDAIRLFEQQVDASTVIINASTRFTDGGEFGFGAEIGISTQRLHARGPMGIKELSSYKFIVTGAGQVR